MKKPRLCLLAALTCLFAVFTLGFFLGRNRNHETVYLSAMPVSPQHSTPLETVSQEIFVPAEVSFPVDINSAGLDELCALPGIGQTLARRILDHRDANGPFERPEELMNVEGIGAGKLESLLDYITTGG